MLTTPLNYAAKAKIVEAGRQIAIRRLAGEKLDPLEYSETLNLLGDVFPELLELERLRMILKRQEADVAAAAAAAAGPRARREAKLAKANEKIAELQRQVCELQKTLPAIAKEDAAVIDKPRQLEGVANATRAHMRSIDATLYLATRDANWGRSPTEAVV